MPQPPSYMEEFSRVDYKDISVDFLVKGDKLGYTFQYEGRNYGNSIEAVLPKTISKKALKKIVDATALLFINAISSHEELCKK